MTLGVFPLHYVSKFQTEIDLSTLEAEYIALSKAMRDLLTLGHFLQDVSTQLSMELASPAIIYFTLFEYNSATLGLATSPSTTPSTRHIDVKYQFFREHVGDGKWIMTQRVLSKEYKPGLFTKIFS